MRIIASKQIKEFTGKHPESGVALNDWYYRTTKANWNNFPDIKKTISGADYVGNSRYVFNINGNNFRLVAIIIFASKKVYLRFIGSHSEYDKIDCQNI